MRIKKLLIANRGEIAIRIARAAADLDIASVAVFSEDDAEALHVRRADSACALAGRGVAAYLDMDQMVALALASGCDAIHPGYGFLAENAQFAQACATQGLRFVGPSPAVLELFGDKVQARLLARRCEVPLVSGTDGPATLEQARALLESLGVAGAIMIKAVAGGGGRGMRAVYDAAAVDEAYTRCQSEASAAFGNGAVYAERLLRPARHIEVQVIGDGSGEVSHLWDRECSLQRRHQKLVEIAPAPGLPVALRERIIAAALRMARAVNYSGLGTFEFLVAADSDLVNADLEFAFMEANPRLQVEHTVTEEITGIDLVQTQLRIAGGATLAELGLLQAAIPAPRGCAVQLRINMERMQADGGALPAGGVLTIFEPPSGPGVRVDTFGYTGYAINPNFDSLLAKLVVHTNGSFSETVARVYRSLCEFRIVGVDTNIGFLQNLLRHPSVAQNQVHTHFVEAHAATLLHTGDQAHRQGYFAGASQTSAERAPARQASAPAGSVALAAPLQGMLVSISVKEGDVVQRGQHIAVLEAMKMEHVVTAERSGVVRKLVAARGTVLYQGDALLYLEAQEGGANAATAAETIDLDHIRADLAELRQRQLAGLDAQRPEAVAKRRKSGQRTARENVDDLCDAGSFVEYGALALAAQRKRRSMEELIRISPADGLIAGLATVNADQFDSETARCMVLAYDFTVLAGTQGFMNHKKIDRMFELAHRRRIPVVLFAEGGGGRPGDTDVAGAAGASSLDVPSFVKFARLSGIAPRVGIVSGYCFAGNAAFLGCCDVIIATPNASIGMGGPAMIEGGGLGIFKPAEVGPVSVQAPNGVIDIEVADEAAAVAAAKKYLAYFQGRQQGWQCADQRTLRHLIPENRLRSYDVMTIIATLADSDSVLELRARFGIGIVTALIRIEGRPFGLLANNSRHLGGAIDADAADKAARFMQLCDTFGLPLLSLCDTPGFMVGPQAEQAATVRHVSRMFVTAAHLRVPLLSIVLRKGYGLGAMAMAGGSFHAADMTIAWPSGEFAAMGIEGAIRLGFARELAAVEDAQARAALFEKMVAEAYAEGRAMNIASFLEIDGVIDPEASRSWITRCLTGLGPIAAPAAEGRRYIDTW